MKNDSMLSALETTLKVNLEMVKNIKMSVSSDADIEAVTYIVVNELHKMTTDILNNNLFVKS